MPAPTVNIRPGQSVVLTAWPTVNGQVGGDLPGPINWSHNSTTVMATFNPVQGNQTTLSIPANSPLNSFTVTATSGGLSATCIIVVTQPADGLMIEAGVPQ